MISDKLHYIFPNGISNLEVAYIQQFISEIVADGILEDCSCDNIRVFVGGLTPLRSHFSVSFECDCGKKRPPIKDKRIDF